MAANGKLGKKVHENYINGYVTVPSKALTLKYKVFTERDDLNN